MTDFNDNPFARDTEVSIFTKNISIRDWLSKNGTLNSIIKNFKYAGVNSNTKGIEYVPYVKF